MPVQRPANNYKFVGAGTAHRAPRLPPEKWEEYKDEITKIYLGSKKLADVVAQMRDIHGFIATKRQFDYRLDEWGVKKLGVPLRLSNNQPPSLVEESAAQHSDRFEGPKRRRSTRSSSTGSGPSNPPRKRPGTTSAEVAANLSSGIIPDKTLLEEIDYAIDDIYETVLHSPGGTCANSGTPITNPHLELANRQATVDRAERPTSKANSGLASVPPSTPQHPPPPTAPLAPAVREILHDQPVDAFGPRDIADMKLAADLFAATGCDQEAFELYTTLLKRHISIAARSDMSFWHLVVQSVYTVSKPEHLMVIHSVLWHGIQKLRWSHNCKIYSGYLLSPCCDYAISLLSHMLLAIACGRVGDSMGAESHIKSAESSLEKVDLWAETSQHRHVSDMFPQDRSLDLVVYHVAYYLRFRGMLAFGTPTELAFQPAAIIHLLPDLTSYFRGPSEALGYDFVSLTPGPFEPLPGLECSEPGTNPCLTSCFLWCEEKLRYLASFSSTPVAEALCPDITAMGWAEANGLYLILWKLWVTEMLSSPLEKVPLWARESQKRMGISPTKLLLLAWGVIYDADGFRILQSSGIELLHRLRRRSTRLAKHYSEHSRVQEFLHQYMVHHSRGITSGLRGKKDPGPERARAITNCLEEALGIAFPKLCGVITPTDDHPARGDAVASSGSGASVSCGPGERLAPLTQQTEATPAHPHVEPGSHTLASSFRSSNRSYASFRDVGERAAAQLRRFARGSISIPSMPSRSMKSAESVYRTPVSQDQISIMSSSFHSLSLTRTWSKDT